MRNFFVWISIISINSSNDHRISSFLRTRSDIMKWKISSKSYSLLQSSSFWKYIYSHRKIISYVIKFFFSFLYSNSFQSSHINFFFIFILHFIFPFPLGFFYTHIWSESFENKSRIEREIWKILFEWIEKVYIYLQITACGYSS